MNLKEYLATKGALTVAQLAAQIGVKSEAQVYQWKAGDSRRNPGPGYSFAIEKATGGKVRRWDLRPNDWYEIWPDLIGAPGAPKVPKQKAKAH